MVKRSVSLAANIAVIAVFGGYLLNPAGAENNMPWLGVELHSEISFAPLDQRAPEDKVSLGVQTIGIVPNSPADNSALIPGDIIVRVDGAGINDAADVAKFVSHSQVGAKITLTVVRAGQEVELPVVLGSKPTIPSTPQQPRKGYVAGWIDAHGGCRGIGRVFYDLSSSFQGDERYMGKRIVDWSDADIKEFNFAVSECGSQVAHGYQGYVSWEAIESNNKLSAIGPTQALIRAVRNARNLKATEAAAEINARRFAEEQAKVKAAEDAARRREEIAAADRRRQEQVTAAEQQSREDAERIAQLKAQSEINAARQKAMLEQAKAHAEADARAAAEVQKQADAEQAALAEARRIAEPALKARREAEERLAKVRAEAQALKAAQEALPKTESSAAKPSKPPDPPGGSLFTAKPITAEAAFGCIDDNVESKIGRMMAQGDKAAWQQLLMQNVVSGQCKLWHRGDEVFPEHTGFARHCLRASGDTDCYWTVREAIE